MQFELERKEIMLEKKKFQLNPTVRPFAPKGIKMRKRLSHDDRVHPQNIKRITAAWIKVFAKNKRLKHNTLTETSNSA